MPAFLSPAGALWRGGERAAAEGRGKVEDGGVALAGRQVLVIIGGGIAAYKSLELIRRLKDRGARVRGVLTAAGAQFITPLSVASLTGEPCYQDLFSLTEEAEMGHIRLAREADVIVVAPATADLMAKMAHGHANDLASTILLATTAPVLIAPAMNVEMWKKPATRRNLEQLKADGIHVVGPGAGDLACGETGPGRMAEVSEILAAVERILDAGPRPLAGVRALVTAGPTLEPIDPVRFISNRSSGLQGYRIAEALAALGADVTLVSGPTNLATPADVRRVDVESAREMWQAVRDALPVDVAVCVAAVADWRVTSPAAEKIKKSRDGLPALELTENPDILASLAALPAGERPRLVIGFAAETEDVVRHAAEKRRRKGADWIVANDVSGGAVMGGARNRVWLIRGDDTPEAWPEMDKAEVARRLAGEIAAHLAGAAEAEGSA